MNSIQGLATCLPFSCRSHVNVGDIWYFFSVVSAFDSCSFSTPSCNATYGYSNFAWGDIFASCTGAPSDKWSQPGALCTWWSFCDQFPSRKHTHYAPHFYLTCNKLKDTKVTKLHCKQIIFNYRYHFTKQLICLHYQEILMKKIFSQQAAQFTLF